MRIAAGIVLVLASVCATALSSQRAETPYPWLGRYDSAQALASRISVPGGYRRTEEGSGTFQHWLRHVPLLPGRPPVLLYSKKPAVQQRSHVAVIDIDVGRRNLQQCADAVIRLRAEYLYAKGAHAAIHFNFTSGDRADFSRWVRGDRVSISGNNVRWQAGPPRAAGHASFRSYLDMVFCYAGTASLERELKPVATPDDVRIGDVFIQGGHPGHAVIVVDVATHKQRGRKIMLLAQSYMPAQQLHVLINPSDAGLGPWYRTDFRKTLATPQWAFRAEHLRRFPDDP